jgi:hypothetical protein
MAALALFQCAAREVWHPVLPQQGDDKATRVAVLDLQEAGRGREELRLPDGRKLVVSGLRLQARDTTILIALAMFSAPAQGGADPIPSGRPSSRLTPSIDVTEDSVLFSFVM